MDHRNNPIPGETTPHPLEKKAETVSALRRPLVAFLLLLLCVSAVLWDDVCAQAATHAKRSKAGVRAKANRNRPQASKKIFDAKAKNAKTSEADPQRGQKIRKDMDDMRQKLNQVKRRVRTRRAQISTAALKLRRKEHSLMRSEARLTSLSQRQQSVQEKTEATQQQLEAQRRLLAERVRRNYERGGTRHAQILLQPHGLAGHSSYPYYMAQIVGHDALEVNRTKAEIHLLAEEEQDLGMRIARQRVVHTNQKIQVARSRADLDRQHRALSQEEAELKGIEENLTLMAAEYEKIARQIRAAQQALSRSGGLPACDGSFVMPIESRISSGYGMRRDPFNRQQQKRHKGIDIAKHEGAAIYAACEGKVIIVDRSPSYGRYIVLAHGGGFSTLYAHCSEVLVSQGAMVRKRQLIARVGRTGHTTGPHLHFEVQYNSKQVDPMPLLKYGATDRMVQRYVNSKRE